MQTRQYFTVGLRFGPQASTRTCVSETTNACCRARGGHQRSHHYSCHAGSCLHLPELITRSFSQVSSLLAPGFWKFALSEPTSGTSPAGTESLMIGTITTHIRRTGFDGGKQHFGALRSFTSYQGSSDCQIACAQMMTNVQS